MNLEIYLLGTNVQRLAKRFANSAEVVYEAFSGQKLLDQRQRIGKRIQ